MRAGQQTYLRVRSDLGDDLITPRAAALDQVLPLVLVAGKVMSMQVGTDLRSAAAPLLHRATLNTRSKLDRDAALEREEQRYRAVETVLRGAGRPLTRSELRAALELEADDSELFHGLVGREPFIEVDSRSWGLVERDLPDGEAGFERALAAIAAANSKDAESAFLTVQQLSSAHASWSYEMAASAYRVYKTRALSFPRTLSGVRMREA